MFHPPGPLPRKRSKCCTRKWRNFETLKFEHYNRNGGSDFESESSCLLLGCWLFDSVSLVLELIRTSSAFVRVCPPGFPTPCWRTCLTESLLVR